ncbi:hypothetical protein CCR75_000420 [Bremia lactucae]|uniref:RNA helicase n=1 Tax=Bremia lactucae TaxID=4779 RepID=A0A976FJ31_BRELC|nr:hypothetical protein CCR75_000420 [Bremia lactucae]
MGPSIDRRDRTRRRSPSRSPRHNRHKSSIKAANSPSHQRYRRHGAHVVDDSPNPQNKNPAQSSSSLSLPALEHREAILKALADHQVVVCIGETGSGKSTQLPQFLHACGAYTDPKLPKCIAITQPRRVATVSVAQRVAQETKTRVGGNGIVGYAIRFESRCSTETKLKFLTDGVLVRECLSDPLLQNYSVVMLDEAHERSIHTDILLGLLKQVIKRRPEFRVLITSATLDADKFAIFFKNPTSIDAKMAKKTQKIKAISCPVIRIPGRVYHVDIFHSKQRQIMGHKGPLSNYVRSAVETTIQVHRGESPGHILVFLTGRREIEEACAEIRALNREQETQTHELELRVLPLYGALSERLQRAIFDPVPINQVRLVIVATNIAETSVTIDGVRYVVDCGFTKQKVYNPAQQIESLIVVPISKVSAQQRAGRAGRTTPGKCFRLYNKTSYDEMAQETVPEIQRTNLANTVLYLKLLGIQDVLGFSYLDPPDEDSLLDALKQLYVLGALDAATGDVTLLGKLMAAFPLEPKLSRAVAESLRLQCSQEMTQVVAMLSIENVLLEPHDYSGKKRFREDKECEQNFDWEERLAALKEQRLIHADGDPLSYRLLYKAFQAKSLKVHGNRKELERWCKDHYLRQRALTLAESIVKQLRDIIHSLPRCDIEAFQDSHIKSLRETSLDDRLRQSLCAGFFMNAARRCTIETVYRLLHRDESDSSMSPLVQFHPLSAMRYSTAPEFCVFQELVLTSKPFMRNAVAVEHHWVLQYSTDKLHVSIAQLYALCGRKSIVNRKETEQATSETKEVDSIECANSRCKVTTDTVNAARARYLARKKGRYDYPDVAL